MLWSFARGGAIAAACLAGYWAQMASAGAGFAPQPMVNEVIVVKLEAPLWLVCRFEAGQLPEVPGFCARLRDDFQRQTGQALAEDTTPAEGGRVLVVTVAPQDDHRAMVTLAAGRQVAGAFVAQTTQKVRLGSVDASLQAGSAAALVYPLASLLETLR